MLLNTGDRVGPYEIIAPLGAGGMGEVYQVRDTRLGRTVAIKVLLPGNLSTDERKHRFFQEARAASALNHPNIAVIHDVGSDRGVDYIVMEYVPGTPLDHLAGRKGLNIGEALEYAVQIADALASAHSAGIVHRDIKPANILVTPQGNVKVLDFGVAKLIEPEPGGNADATRTIAAAGERTKDGVIVGTAAYLSPEQARGENVDRRSDIFAFGAVLYELITGRRAFPGESMVTIIAGILKDEPIAASQVRATVPAGLDKIIQRCLKKDVSRRFQHIDDVRVELLEQKDELSGAPVVPPVAVPNGGYGNPLWMLLGALIMAGVWLFTEGHKNTHEPVLAAVPLTTYPGSERFATFSPDGNQVAFTWDGEKQDNFDVYIKLVGTGAPLRITSDPAPDFYPAWSPDGRWIAFLRLLGENRASVVLVPALGGPERKLADTEVPAQVAYVQGVNPPRISWSADGAYLVIVDRSGSSDSFGLYSLSIDSGEKHRLTKSSDPALMDSGPAVSPNGEAVAFTRTSRNLGVGDLYVLKLAAGMKPVGAPQRLTTDNRQNGHPAWTADGHDIIFSSPRSGGTFELWKMPATATAEPKRLASIGEDGIYPAVSRQGKRLIYTKYGLDSNIWRIDAQTSSSATGTASVIPLVTSTRQDVMPAYSPDGRKVAFASDRSGFFEIWTCASDGSDAVQLTSLEGANFHPAWSPNGQLIAFESNSGGRDGVYVVNSAGGKPKPLTNAQITANWPTFSSDGRWIYFNSAQNGHEEVWKVSAQGGEPVQVTKTGGYLATESPDGQFLYHMKSSRSGPLFRVPTAGGEEVQVLDKVAARGYAVTKDGIYFITAPASVPMSEYYEVNSQNTLQFLNFRSGSRRVVAQLPKPLQLGITVSPDGRWILYPQIDKRVEDLMLIEHFQ